jgi:hypothetical protein
MAMLSMAILHLGPLLGAMCYIWILCHLRAPQGQTCHAILQPSRMEKRSCADVVLGVAFFWLFFLLFFEKKCKETQAKQPK